MANLKEVDKNVLANAQANPMPTEEQANAAVVNSDMPPGFNLPVYLNRQILGRYLAPAQAGIILTQATITRSEQERIKKVMMEMIEAKPGPDTPPELLVLGAEGKIAAAEVVCKIHKNENEAIGAILKAAEIACLGAEKEKKQTVAPQVHAKMAFVTVGQQQVNLDKATQ